MQVVKNLSEGMILSPYKDAIILVLRLTIINGEIFSSL